MLLAGSFRDHDQAQRLRDRLRGEGLKASIHEADLGKRGIWHRVQLGPFTSRSSMAQARSRLTDLGVQSQAQRFHAPQAKRQDCDPAQETCPPPSSQSAQSPPSS